MFAWLRSLFRRRVEESPIDEETAYANSYGIRTGDIVAVERVPEPEPELSPLERGELTGEVLRRAFEQKLEKRKKLVN